MKICHVTVLHPGLDRRIFHKECAALRDAGHDVYLILPDGKVDREVIDGITVITGPRLTGKRRVFQCCNEVFRIARDLRADAYHLHDSWLLPFGFKVKKRLGSLVVFDSHEDFVGMCGGGRPWIPIGLRDRARRVVSGCERRAARRFDAFVTVAEPTRRRASAPH